MPQLFANNAVSTLAAAITISGTSMTLTTGEGAKFPAITGSDNFLVTLVGGTASSETSWEIVNVTARAGDVLTVVRAREGTAAAAWAINTPVELRATAATLAGLATTGANIFTGAQNNATGAAIASAATLNLDTATGNRVHITGTTTITAVTLARGPRTLIFDGVLTLTHNATTNNLPGAANITTAAGDRAIYESDGATVYCVSYVKANGFAVIGSVGDHEIAIHTGNGYGSTNTVIRRFTTTLTSTGTAITYADSATLGAALTINETGLYAIYYSDVAPSGVIQPGASVNSAQLTTSISLINVANRLTLSASLGTGQAASMSRVVRLTAGDVVRPHTNGTAGATTEVVFFAIRKVGI